MLVKVEDDWCYYILLCEQEVKESMLVQANVFQLNFWA